MVFFIFSHPPPCKKMKIVNILNLTFIFNIYIKKIKYI